MEPEGDWRAWYVRGGRGSGKTRTGAETLAGWVLDHEPGDWAVVAPTYGDARDVCVEGVSGLLSTLGPAVEQWNRSLGELKVANGARIYIDGADDGALRLQGKRFRGAWCDEVGLWREWKRAWHESLLFAVTFDPATIVATGTPKGKVGIPRLLVEDETVPVTRLLMRDNIANLSEAMVEQLERDYAGTRLGRQELEGELLDDVEGALWSWELLEAGRVSERPEAFSRVVVAIDPAVTVSADSDETGIVAAGLGADEHGYVLADRSGKFSPNVWATRAIDLFHELRADRIVAERNQGGDMVAQTLKTVDPSVPVRLIHASRGKQVRADAVAALYEQGRVHHVGGFPELETQLTSWTPEESASPDRLDAVVYAIRELMVDRRPVPQVDAVGVAGRSSWRT